MWQIMYRQLQGQVNEYLINDLCRISKSWRFDICTENDSPIIVGYGPDGLVIRGAIEELIDKFFVCDSAILVWEIAYYYNFDYLNMCWWGGFMLIGYWFDKVFQIYGAGLVCVLDNNENNGHIRYQIVKRDNLNEIKSYIHNNKLHCCDNFVSPLMDCDLDEIEELDPHRNCGIFVSPFVDCDLNKYIEREELVPPFLLLLDPIEYFRRYSIIIKKYPELDQGHTLGVYELLLTYFPEMNEELIEKYWGITYIFEDWCVDIVYVVRVALVSLCI